LERALPDGLAEHHRKLQQEGFAGRLSIERMALDLDAVPRDMRASIARLIPDSRLDAQATLQRPLIVEGVSYGFLKK